MTLKDIELFKNQLGFINKLNIKISSDEENDGTTQVGILFKTFSKEELKENIIDIIPKCLLDLEIEKISFWGFGDNETELVVRINVPHKLFQKNKIAWLPEFISGNKKDIYYWK